MSVKFVDIPASGSEPSIQGNKQTNKQTTDRPTIQTNVRFVQNRMQQMSIYLRNDRISTRPDGMVPVSWLLSKSSRAAINSD